jgi:hypothetical protein
MGMRQVVDTNEPEMQRATRECSCQGLRNNYQHALLLLTLSRNWLTLGSGVALFAGSLWTVKELLPAMADDILVRSVLGVPIGIFYFLCREAEKATRWYCEELARPSFERELAEFRITVASVEDSERRDTAELKLLDHLLSRHKAEAKHRLRLLDRISGDTVSREAMAPAREQAPRGDVGVGPKLVPNVDSATA